jgi:hypothetical protein
MGGGSRGFVEQSCCAAAASNRDHHRPRGAVGTTFVSLIAVPMCLSSRIIMVLAWIYRNIFALCVALQVGSLLAVAGRRIQKVYSRAGGTAACRPGTDGHVHQLALGRHMGPDRQLRRCRRGAGAPESDRGVVPARAIRRCRHRILLIRRCAGAAAGRRRVARPPSMGGGSRRAGGARQHPRPRRRSGAPSRLGSWCSSPPTRDPTPAAAPERSLAASGCRAVTVCTGAPHPWACELGGGTMSAEPGRHAIWAPAESRPRRR